MARPAEGHLQTAQYGKAQRSLMGSVCWEEKAARVMPHSMVDAVYVTDTCAYKWLAQKSLQYEA